MRILHTSDWHLGRSFGEHRLLDEQAGFVDWLVQVVRAEAIDLVVIAGDLYDRSAPPADAVSLLHSAFLRLIDAGADVAAIAGNHDSAERVGSVEGLLTPKLLLRGGYGHAAEVDLRHYTDGPLAIIAVPFLDPAFAPRDHNNPAGDRTSRPTHESVLASAVTSARDHVTPGTRTLAIAHAFVTGAEPSASERTLAVGDAAMVSSQVFSGIDYVALGHLHRPQLVAGEERLRYSGSPLPYSFGETHTKEVVLIELDADGDMRTKPIPIDNVRSVVTMRGTLDELRAGDTVNEWARVELTNTHPVADAHRRLRDRFPHLVEITRTASPRATDQRLSSEAVRTRTPAELATTFLHEIDNAVTDDEIALVHRALNQHG